jgi:hypothetical protein
MINAKGFLNVCDYRNFEESAKIAWKQKLHT